MSFQPDCKKLTAASATWAGYLAELYDHFANTSTKFTVAHETNDGGPAGNVSFLVEPADSQENWHLNLRENGSGELVGMIDPSAQITDSSSPTSSASSEASSEVVVGESLPGHETDFLIAEHVDMIQLLWKDSSGYTPEGAQLGKVYISGFASDSGADMDGLGLLVDQPGWDGSIPTLWLGDYSQNSVVRVDTTTWSTAHGVSAVSPDKLTGGSGVPNRPSIVPVLAGGNDGTMVGVAKYVFLIADVFGSLIRREDGSGKGVMHIMRDSGASQRCVVPWDPAVVP